MSIHWARRVIKQNLFSLSLTSPLTPPIPLPPPRGYQPAARFQAARYGAGLSSEHCTRSRSYNSLIDGTCEECTFLRGLENLRFNNENDLLIWMNQIYRASVYEKPEPYDQAINDSLKIISAVMRKKTIVKRVAMTFEGAVFDERRFNTRKRVACLTPYDIFQQEREPRVGRGTHEGNTLRGHFGTMLVNSVMKTVAIDGE